MEWLNESSEESFLDDPDFVKAYSHALVNRIVDKFLPSIEVNVNYWVQMGLSRAKMDERSNDIADVYDKVSKDCNDTERESFDKLICYKESKLKEINTILSDLSLEPFEVPNDLSLLKLAKILYLKHDELNKVKNERMVTLTELKSLRAHLCCSLNIQPKPFTTQTNIPSERELDELKHYVNELKKEKSKRLKSFQTKKKMIHDLFTDLERDINNDFEKEILCGETDKFILSDDNMKKVQHLHSELESHYFNNDEKRKLYQEKLSGLYQRLEVSKPHRDKFLANDIGCKPSVLAVLEKEIEIYEALKRQNIERFTVQIRDELVEWYEKCCISIEEKSRFQTFLEDNNFTEELLEAHESELNRLKTLYNECQTMFEFLNKWKEKFNRWCELENNMFHPNPERFNNRGGALLQEEKDRKQLKKELPKLEECVIKLCRERLQNTGQKFLVYGLTVQNYFSNYREEYRETIENEKRERQKAKQNEMQAHLKGKKVTPCGGGVFLRRTPVKRALTAMSPNCDASGGKQRRIGAPLTPIQVNNNAVTATNQYPMAKPRARNLANQLNECQSREASLLSINESEFQAPLCDRDNANSTFISVPRQQTPVKQQAAHVTNRRRRIPQKKGLNRRKSRSCSDLAEAIKTNLQIGSASRGAPLASIRSTPASPHAKSNVSSTPNRFPRFAVAQRKPPFVV